MHWRSLVLVGAVIVSLLAQPVQPAQAEGEDPNLLAVCLSWHGGHTGQKCAPPNAGDSGRMIVRPGQQISLGFSPLAYDLYYERFEASWSDNITFTQAYPRGGFHRRGNHAWWTPEERGRTYSLFFTINDDVREGEAIQFRTNWRGRTNGNASFTLRVSSKADHRVLGKPQVMLECVTGEGIRIWGRNLGRPMSVGRDVWFFGDGDHWNREVFAVWHFPKERIPSHTKEWTLIGVLATADISSFGQVTARLYGGSKPLDGQGQVHWVETICLRSRY